MICTGDWTYILAPICTLKIVFEWAILNPLLFAVMLLVAFVIARKLKLFDICMYG